MLILKGQQGWGVGGVGVGGLSGLNVSGEYHSPDAVHKTQLNVCVGAEEGGVEEYYYLVSVLSGLRLNAGKVALQ